MRPIVLSNKLCDNVLVNEDTVSNKLAVAVGHVTVEQIDAAFNNPTTGLKQLIERVAAKKCDCAKTMCGGHGRCHGVGVGGYAACQCFQGYSGPNCTKQTTTPALPEAGAGSPVGGDGSSGSDGESDRVACPDAISSCGAGQTCGQFVGGRWGCCPLAQAVLCGDAQHCCAAGYSCDAAAGVCYK